MKILIGKECYHLPHPDGAVEELYTNELGNVALFTRTKCGLRETMGAELSDPIEESELDKSLGYRRCQNCFGRTKNPHAQTNK